MKNILIAGVPRSGKTTLSMLLANELKNYHIISLDCIRNALDDIFPQLEINPRDGKNNFTELPKLVSRILYYNKRDLRNKINYIIEGTQILPDTAKELFNDCIVIFLGHGNMKPEQILDNIRKYDTPEEYSYSRDDETMMKSIIKHIKIDHEIEQKCKLYGFNYIDTSSNRAEKLNKLVEEVKRDIYY